MWFIFKRKKWNVSKAYLSADILVRDVEKFVFGSLHFSGGQWMQGWLFDLKSVKSNVSEWLLIAEIVTVLDWEIRRKKAKADGMGSRKEKGPSKIHSSSLEEFSEERKREREEMPGQVKVSEGERFIKELGSSSTSPCDEHLVQRATLFQLQHQKSTPVSFSWFSSFNNSIIDCVPAPE